MPHLVSFLAITLLSVNLSASAPQGYYRFPAIHNDTILFTSEGDLWKVSTKGGVAQRLTTHPGTESHSTISPDGRSVAFSAEYEGPTEVYTMPVTGGLPTRHTYDGAATTIGWSSNGKLIYSTRNFSTLPNTQLVLLDPKSNERQILALSQASEGTFNRESNTLYFTRLPFQGSSTKRYKGGTTQNLWKYVEGEPEAVPLTTGFSGTSKNPMWSQGRIYFISDRDGTMNLWSMQSDGEKVKQHTHHNGFDVKSASLDNGRIVYQHGANLRLIEIATGLDAIIPITLSTDLDQKREKWIKKPMDYLTTVHLSPDGDRVVLTARGQVFVAPVKQGRFVEVPRTQGVRYRNARFLPDDKNLMALSDETGELEFWKLPANGVGEPNQLTTDGTVFRFEGIPSPDGKWIAYQDKNQQLWVFNFGDNQSRLIASSRTEGFDDLTWAPDSQWIAYVEAAANTYRQIHVLNVGDGTRATLTGDRVDSYSPAWSPDGKRLYFLSDRQLRSLVRSPWGPRQPDPFFADTTKIYQLSLTKGLRSPFQPNDELEHSEDISKRVDVTAEDETQEGSTNDVDKVSVSIDLLDLNQRLEEVPIPAGNYASLAITGKRLIWTSRETGFNAKTHLQVMDIGNESPKPKKLVEEIRGFELSLNKKKLLIRKGENLYVIDADSVPGAKLDEGKVDLEGWTFSIDPQEEWNQIFKESWRMLRDYFYDTNMHGVDWPRMLAKYSPLVDRVTDRGELSEVISEMAGELSALHIFVRYGDEREGPDKIQPAFLGAQLKWNDPSGGWVVKHVYRSDPDYPAESSPLARRGVDLQEGDTFVSINGIGTSAVTHPNALLRNRAGKQVLMEVKSPKAEKSRHVIVQPITANEEAELRYDEWEYTRRLRVEEVGQGQIGYVHLRAMGSANIAEWARDFYPVFDRAGLIIDVRHNRGGNIDSWILGKLLRKAWFFWKPRIGMPIWNMQYAFRGHVVVLCNERTASDGEAFTEGFRRLGLGKVIGTRTWGGEIWLSARRWLVDSGMATAAEIGVYGPEGEWLIEGHGVDPDIVVDNSPHATFLGEDAQLDAALRHLQELIAKDPRPIPPVPPYPDKSQP